MGLESEVKAEIGEMVPNVVFQVRVLGEVGRNAMTGR